MTKRFYSGARESSNKLGEAARIKKMEIQKGGKLPLTSTQRYKMMMEAKLAEHQRESRSKNSVVFTPPGAQPVKQVLSYKAQQALKQIAQRKAAKKEKELRRMVPIIPCHYQEGRLDAKGRVWDVANNQVLKVNHKNGKITTLTGWNIGKYKPKSLMNRMMISEAIKKHSPYYMRLRQIQMLQEQERLRQMAEQHQLGLAAQQTLAQMYGLTQDPNAIGGEANAQMDMYQRVGFSANAWGVMSGNVHGSFAENVHGGFADNVWGTASANIWGGIGGGWRTMRGPRIWGSGSANQKNYLKPLIAIFTSFFNTRSTRRALNAARTGGNAGGRR